MSEVNFWTRIVDNCWRNDRVLNRVENGVLDGMPDSYYCIDGIMGWIELKVPDEPNRETTALFSGSHKLSQSQRNWMLAHEQAGGRRVFVGIETPRTTLLVPGKHADSINKMTLFQLIDASWFWAKRPLSRKDWDAFVMCLQGVNMNG